MLGSQTIADVAVACIVVQGPGSLVICLEQFDSFLYIVINNRYRINKDYLLFKVYRLKFQVLLELASFDFGMWPNTTRWLERVKMLPYWGEVHEFHDQIVAQIRKQNGSVD